MSQSSMIGRPGSQQDAQQRLNEKAQKEVKELQQALVKFKRKSIQFDQLM